MSDYKNCAGCGEAKLPEMFRWMADRGRHRARCLSCEREQSLARYHHKAKKVPQSTEAEVCRSIGVKDKRINRETLWAVPQHEYTAADFAVREWRTARPVGAVFAPSLGIAA